MDMYSFFRIGKKCFINNALNTNAIKGLASNFMKERTNFEDVRKLNMYMEV